MGDVRHLWANWRVMEWWWLSVIDYHTQTWTDWRLMMSGWIGSRVPTGGRVKIHWDKPSCFNFQSTANLICRFSICVSLQQIDLHAELNSARKEPWGQVSIFVLFKSSIITIRLLFFCQTLSNKWAYQRQYVFTKSRLSQ